VLTPPSLYKLQLLEQHTGQDITQFFQGLQGGHKHSNAAHKMLDSFYLCNLDDKISKSTTTTNSTTPTTTTKYDIDETKPILEQVGKLGDSYLEWVHSPVPGQPRFFHSNMAEGLTKVKWWVVPLVWLPLVIFSLFTSINNYNNNYYYHSSSITNNIIINFCLGIATWQALEYSIHRWLFHIHPIGPRTIFLHFLIHGCHHKYPMDIERLVFPPIPGSWLIGPLWVVLHIALPSWVASSYFAGIIGGYVTYDVTHYLMHSGWQVEVLKGRRVKHMAHHYGQMDKGFGISTSLFDWLLGTQIGVVGGDGEKKKMG